MFDSWENNCAANNVTNGVDEKGNGVFSNAARLNGRPLARGVITDVAPSNAIGLPQQFQPSLPQVNTSAGVIKSYILPDNQTGVVNIYVILVTFHSSENGARF